jgi:hypothetical protein
VERSSLETALTVASACRLLGLTWVGVRVLEKGWKARAVPELLLGTSFLTFTTLGVPLLGLSGYGAASVADANAPLLGLALGLLDFGTACFAAFVWRVFRSGSTIASTAVATASAILAVHVTLATHAVAMAPAEMSPIQAIGSVELLLSSVMSATFAWGAVEAFSFWRRLRKRHAIGLADPVVMRRMLWFAIGCAAQLGMMAFTMLATLRGTNALADPLPALGIAATSLATGAAFLIALGSRAPRAEARSPAGASTHA